MGLADFLFGVSTEEAEEFRGVPDDVLPKLTNEQLILIGLARLYDGMGLQDDALVEEMRARAQQGEKK